MFAYAFLSPAVYFFLSPVYFTLVSIYPMEYYESFQSPDTGNYCSMIWQYPQGKTFRTFLPPAQVSGFLLSLFLSS